MTPYPLRTPRSSTGHTSRRPNWNIRNISAVHRPMPHRHELLHDLVVGEPGHPIELHGAVEHLLGEVTDRCRLVGRQPGTPQRVERRREHRFGFGHAVEQGLDPAVDGAGGWTRELLVTHCAHQLGEMRAPRSAAAEIARAGPFDDRPEGGCCSASARSASISSRRAIPRTVVRRRANYDALRESQPSSSAFSVRGSRAAARRVRRWRRRQRVQGLPQSAGAHRQGHRHHRSRVRLVRRDGEDLGETGRRLRQPHRRQPQRGARQPMADRPRLPRRQDPSGLPGEKPAEGLGAGAAPGAAQRHHRLGPCLRRRHPSEHLPGQGGARRAPDHGDQLGPGPLHGCGRGRHR